MTKRKPGRPKKPGGPAIKLSISIPPKTLEAIDRARGRMSRSRFLLTKAGYSQPVRIMNPDGTTETVKDGETK